MLTSPEHRQQLEAVARRTRSTSSLYARRQIDADASRLQSRLTNTNVAIAIRAKMQPVGWEKDLAPRPAFVSAKTHDLIAPHRTAVLLVAAFSHHRSRGQRRDCQRALLRRLTQHVSAGLKVISSWPPRKGSPDEDTNATETLSFGEVVRSPPSEI